MRRRPVAVLGCGPAGLFAASAAESLGWDVTVFSRKRKSPLYGAQYLHQPIPELTPDHGQLIDYQLVGTAEEYRQKVYGDRQVDVSPSLLQGKQMAWNIRSTYDIAWNWWQDEIADFGKAFNGQDMSNFLSGNQRAFKVVISTIPAPAICIDPNHQFASERVWAVGDAPDLGQYCQIRVPPWTVVCDGTEDRGWYRASNVFGHKTAEWASERKPPVDNAVQVVKPISTNCNCFGRKFFRVGRYGSWTKGVLAHEAYTKTLEILG